MGTGKATYYSSPVRNFIGKSIGMAWRDWESMETLHFPIFHPEQASKPTYTVERKIDIGEK